MKIKMNEWKCNKNENMDVWMNEGMKEIMENMQFLLFCNRACNLRELTHAGFNTCVS